MSVVSSKDFSSCIIPHLNKLDSDVEAQAVAPTAQPLVRAPLHQEQHIPPQASPVMPTTTCSKQILASPSQPGSSVEEQVPGSVAPTLPAPVSTDHCYQIPQEHYCELRQPLSGLQNPPELDLLTHESAKGSDEVTCIPRTKPEPSLEVHGVGASALYVNTDSNASKPGMLGDSQIGWNVNGEKQVNGSSQGLCQLATNVEGNSASNGMRVDGLNVQVGSKDRLDREVKT